MNISSFVNDHVADNEWIRIRSTRIVNLQRCSRTAIPCVAAAAAEHPSSSSSSSSSSRQRTQCQPSERTPMHRDRLLRLLDEAVEISAIGNRDGVTAPANRGRV